MSNDDVVDYILVPTSINLCLSKIRLQQQTAEYASSTVRKYVFVVFIPIIVVLDSKIVRPTPSPADRFPLYSLKDMGGGASSLIRLRKAIIIRSYNLRKPEETVDQQFRKFAVRGEDGVLIISLQNIRNCLEMESKEYDWIDHLFLRIFGGQVGW